MSVRRRGRLGAVLAITLATGCTDENVTPLGGGSSSGDASSSSGSTSSGMESPIREVFVRNPWGGTPPNNLLVDGDFEFSITTGDGQYGWILIDENSGATLPLDTETGGLCKSGLKCGLAPSGTILFGRGTAAADLAPMRATMFVHPTTPPEEGADLVKYCKAAIDAYVISCDSFDIVSHLTAVGSPDDKGWCEYGIDVPGSLGSVCIYGTMMKSSLVDACTLLPSGAPPDAPTAHALTKGTDAMKRVGERIRSRMRFDRPALREADR